MFCSYAAVFRRNPQALSAEQQSCTSATAQGPCLIVSYLNKCSGIRVWMLARHLGKDLGYNSSPDSQGEKACGLLCGRGTGYKEYLWLWVQDKQTLKSILADVSTLLGQHHWQGSQRAEIMSWLYSQCHCHGTRHLMHSKVEDWRQYGGKHCFSWRQDNLPVDQLLLESSCGLSSPRFRLWTLLIVGLKPF